MAARRVKLSAYKEIALYFLKLGCLGFGGPLALMAAYQKDLVEKRKWIGTEKFARALSLIKALPGPVATQLAIYLGRERGGTLGGLLSGACLILPSFIMMVLLGVFYTSVETLSWSRPLLLGMQAAALGVILQSAWQLSAPYRREPVFAAVALVGGTLTFLKPSSEPLVILGAGFLGFWLKYRHKLRGTTATGVLLAALPSTTAMISAAPVAQTPVLLQLFGVMLKAGTLVFGTGLAIIPLLSNDVVTQHQWLTTSQFRDALAFGQITPGPVSITATFIGFKVAGVVGAIVATVGMFGPAFFNILTWFPYAERKFANSPYAKPFVMWALAAVVGSIVVTVYRLAMAPHSAVVGDAWLAGIGATALFASLVTRVPVWILIPLGGAITTLIDILRPPF